MRQFETFSAFHTLIVHKEPLKQFYNSSIPTLAGYGTEIGGDEGYTSIPVSGMFPFVVVGKSAKDRTYTDFRAEVNKNVLRVKVTEEARNFINSGNNLFFEIDGRAYNQLNTEETQNFLGLRFFIYSLSETS